MNSLQRRLRNEEYRQAALQLCSGLKARVVHKVQNNCDSYTLAITKNGKPFKDFTIGATLDWMSGNFSISGRVIYGWDRGSRTKRREHDCWKTHAYHIADIVNHYSKEAARAATLFASVTSSS